MHLRINIITDNSKCVKISLDNVKKTGLGKEAWDKWHTVQRRGGWGAGWGEYRRATEAGTSHKWPQPVCPGPGSTEACQHQQKINKLRVWECLDVGRGWGPHKHSHRGLHWLNPALTWFQFIYTDMNYKWKTILKVVGMTTHTHARCNPSSLSAT